MSRVLIWGGLPLAFTVFALSLTPVAADDIGHRCDLLASSPNEPAAGVDGIEFDALDGMAARQACEAAVAAYPDVVRYGFQLGRAEQRLGHYDVALALFTRAAAGGHQLSNVAIGVLHDQGLGVPQDFAKAAEFYARAADAGIGVALNNLGSLHADGQGVARDAAKAERLYRQALEKGYVPAAGNLADLLASTYVPGSDPTPVVRAHVDAAARGLAAAETRLAGFYRDGTFGLSSDVAVATAHYVSAEKAGDGWAKLYRAQMIGFGRPGAVEEASTLLREIREQEEGTLKAEATRSSCTAHPAIRRLRR